jgi:hypothetical protein
MPAGPARQQSRSTQLPWVFMSDPDRVEPSRHHGDFWSQVPVVLFTMTAVVALFLVNHRTQAAPPPPAAPVTVEVKPAPVECTDCGEVIAVRPVPADEVGGSDAIEGAVLLDVRMGDGTVRTIRQLPAGMDVGDRVQVIGNTLVARS